MTNYDLALLIVLLAATGAFAGIVAGLLGIGGGLFVVPVLLFVFHLVDVEDAVLMQICVGTSTATVVATSLRSTLVHRRRGTVRMDILARWAPFLAVGAVIGVLVATSLRSDTLMLMFGVLAVVMGAYIAVGNPDWRLGKDVPGLAVRAPMATAMGVICAMMGIGGGTFGVPTLTAYGVALQPAIATAAGFGTVLSAPAVVAFLLAEQAGPVPPYTIGYVNLPAFVIIVAMTILTVPIGVKLMHVLPGVVLRRVFAFFIVIAGANMIRQALG